MADSWEDQADGEGERVECDTRQQNQGCLRKTTFDENRRSTDETAVLRCPSVTHGADKLRGATPRKEKKQAEAAEKPGPGLCLPLRPSFETPA